MHHKLLRKFPIFFTLSTSVALMILLEIFPVLLFSGILFFIYWLFCRLLPCHFSYLNAAILSALPICSYFIQVIKSAKSFKDSAFRDDDRTGDMDNDEDKWEMDDSDERAKSVLGKHWKNVSNKSLAKYHDHLKNKITYPCMVTGIEEFEWEHLYSWVPGKKKEYTKLKQTKPCASAFTKQRDFFAADRRQLALGILEEALSYFAIPEALELSLSFLEKSKNRQEQNSALSLVGEYSYQCEDSFIEYKKQVCHSLKSFIKINKHESTGRAAKLLEGLRSY